MSCESVDLWSIEVITHLVVETTRKLRLDLEIQKANLNLETIIPA